MMCLLVACIVGGCVTTEPRDDTNQPVYGTIAVLYFANNSVTNRQAQEPWRKLITDVLITDLSSVPGLTVVERSRLEDVLDELALGSSELADRDTQLRLGRLLGARALVVGDYIVLGPTLRIDARVVDVETSEIVYAGEVTGPRGHMFELAWMLAGRLSAGLGLNLPDAPRARIGHSSVAPAYAHGLELLDAGDLEGARRAFEQVLDEDPGNAGARARIEEIKRRD